MNIHILCADPQGFSETDFSSNFDKDITLSFSTCKNNIILIEKALNDILHKTNSPDLIIIYKSLGEDNENSFRKTFAGIIYRAEKKVQEKPWIEVKKQLKQQKKSKTEHSPSDNNEKSEEIGNIVPYNKKKTHIFSIERDGSVAYTFPYLSTQVLVLPKDANIEEIPEVSKKAQQIFTDSQEEYPEGYRLIPKTYKIMSFREKYLPSREDSSNEKIRKSVQMLACLVFLVAGILFLHNIIYLPFENAMVTSEIQTIFYEDETDPKTGEKVIKSANWKKLKEVNKEIVGWIKLNNTHIDYPVLWHKEDSSKSQYYLYRNYKKEYSDYGSIFMDYRSKQGLESKNAILHGHHMNDGSMFGDLMKYGTTTGNLDFYKKSPTIQISTEKGGTETYKIFSVFKSNVNTKQGEYFDFYCSDFKSDSQFMNYVYNLQIRSLITTPVTVNEKDQLLTLVTCSYEFNNFRTIIVARKTRKGESVEVDTGKASIPSSSLWPQVYYSNNGKTRPTVSTFKEEYKKGNTPWYDGAGKLKGNEELPTSTLITQPTVATSTKATTKPTTATATVPTVTDPIVYQKTTHYIVQVYNRGQMIKMENIKAGNSFKLPKIDTTYEDDGYEYTFDKWEIKGSKTVEKITQNTVITAVYKKSKIKETAKVTEPTKASSTKATARPTEKVTQYTTKPTVPKAEADEDNGDASNTVDENVKETEASE